ncbi:MAG: MFS transporter [Thermodesulfobacteriota bacterium]|nr:MFS transporter [Thermodesulfobacteriota bacterium]
MNRKGDLVNIKGLPENKRFDYAWVVVTAGFFLVLILYGTYYCFGVFLKPMLAELSWSRARTTGAVSVYMIVHGAFGIIMGVLSDKYGPRLVVVISCLTVALGYSLISRITSPWHLYLFFGVFVGIGMGAAYVPPISTVTRWFTAKRGLALGVMAAGVGVGQMILPPLMRHLITLVGWRSSFIIVGAMIILVGLPSALLLKDPPDNADFQPNGEFEEEKKSNESMDEYQIHFSLREAIRTLSFTLLLFIFISLVFGLSIVLSHLVAHLEDIGIDPVTAAFVISIIGVTGIFGRIIIGGAADRFGSKTMLPACLMLQAVLIFFLIWAKDLWHFYTIASLFGLSYGGTLPLILKISSEYFGVISIGTIFGFLIFGGTSGGAVGAPIAGYVYDITGNYSIAFLLGAIVIAGASILCIIIKPPKKPDKSQDIHMEKTHPI